jgi:hypothetical protein
VTPVILSKAKGSGVYSICVTGKDVYAAGNNGNTLVYWKNGKTIKLTDGKEMGGASSVFVSGNDVYVAGSEYKNYSSVAKYWKNGKEMILKNGTHAYSVFVSGGDVYVAGDIMHTATYWKNGEEFKLKMRHDGKYESHANSIFVYNNDVYVAGYEMYGSNRVAKYWKNGKPVDLSDDKEYADVYSIFVTEK